MGRWLGHRVFRGRENGAGRSRSGTTIDNLESHGGSQIYPCHSKVSREIVYLYSPSIQQSRVSSNGSRTMLRSRRRDSEGDGSGMRGGMQVPVKPVGEREVSIAGTRSLLGSVRLAGLA